MSAPASTSVLAVALGRHDRHAVAQRAAQRRGRRAGGGEERRPPSRGRPAAGAARAGTAAAPGAPRGRTKAIRTGPAGRAGALGHGRARRAAPGSGRGSARSMRSRVASKDAVRASRRPKKRSTKRRATCVEITRSVGAWNVPTLSAREWRSATEEALGANGSCTWTKSSGARVSDLLDRARDVERRRGRRAAARRRQRQQLADAEHGDAAVGVEQRRRRGSAGATRARASGERDGASTSTRCPRAASSADSARTNALTSCSSSQGYGVTWAIA